MNWLDTLLGGTRARLLRLVRRGAASIGDLAGAVGITDNAVRGHVAALERDGLVRAESQRPTGGKPARLYELTPEAEELFPKAYALVLEEMLATIRRRDGDEAALDTLRAVGRRLGEGGGAGHAGDTARVAAASALLERLGGSIEAERTEEGWVLRSAGCPLSRVVTESPDYCCLVEAMLSEVTGGPVREVCDRAGRPRCSFVIGATDA